MTAAESTPVPGLAPDDTLRVLVVEDDESVRRIICRRLQQAGVEVVSASSGEEAMTRFPPTGSPVHLLITDGIMPGMDGFDLARHFAQRTPPVKTVLISGFLGHFVARPDIPENVEAFFPKPFASEELVAKVLDLLGAPA